MNELDTKKVLSSYILVQEKIDGLNIGIDVKDDGYILINKDNKVPTNDYFLYSEVIDLLCSDSVSYIKNENIAIFGEYFENKEGMKKWVVFDIFDKNKSRFIKYRDIVYHSGYLHFDVAPILYRGIPNTLETIKNLITESQFNSSKMEGVVMRIEDENFLRERYKYVREDFVKE